MTFIAAGWGLQAQAQPADFSLPPLPGLPPIANASSPAAAPVPDTVLPPNAGAKPTADSQPKVDGEDAIPELATLPVPSTPPPPGLPANDPSATSTEPATNADAETAAEPEAVAEGTDKVPGEGSPPGATPALPAFDLALPPVPPTLPTDTATVPAATTPALTATSIPEIAVEAPGKPMLPKLGGVTWKTTLAPAIVPPRTNFNYRRQILPDVIYQPEYGRENQHLPTRVTREDYARLLTERVAANDLDGTRALLNTGLPVTTTDPSGRNLLAIARHAGARDTERLLLARGAS